MTLIAKGVGAPDYSVALGGIKPQVASVLPYKPDYVLSDMAESAIRTGAPPSFDRRGDVIFSDDFRGGLGRWYFPGGGTAPVLIMPAGVLGVAAEQYPTISGMAALLSPASGVNNASQMLVSIPIIGESRYGFEVGITLSDTTMEMDIQSYLYTGLLRYYGAFTIDVTNKNMTFQDENDIETTLLEGDPQIPRNSISYVKLVCDLTDKKYERALANGYEFDLSNYKMNSVADSTFPHLEFQVSARNQHVSTRAKMILQYGIITKNEPAN